MFFLLFAKFHAFYITEEIGTWYGCKICKNCKIYEYTRQSLYNSRTTTYVTTIINAAKQKLYFYTLYYINLFYKCSIHLH